MKLIHYYDAEAQKLPLEGAEGVTLRVLVSQADGANKFTMMQLTIAPGGNTPGHTHPWEEQMYLLSGQGEMVSNEIKKPIRPGDTMFFEADEHHQVINTGDEPLELLALIPNS